MKARIEWLIPEPRRSAIINGNRYTTVLKFIDEMLEDNSSEYWSLDLKDFTIENDGMIVANVQFLSLEAPIEKLIAGAKFELFEGSRCTARGVILDN